MNNPKIYKHPLSFLENFTKTTTINRAGVFWSVHGGNLYIGGEYMSDKPENFGKITCILRDDKYMYPLIIRDHPEIKIEDTEQSQGTADPYNLVYKLSRQLKVKSKLSEVTFI